MRLIMELARTQGFIWLHQVHKIYQTQKASREALKWLVCNNYLKLTSKHGYYVIGSPHREPNHKVGGVEG
jgi:hypothetical protein